MPNDFFRFKEFTVFQDRCAMKVSTDACLLGAWAPFRKNVRAVLDIGAGTGLLSLMLAQRFSQAKITALEIDQQAAEQARENVAGSLFADRVTVVCGDVRAFQPEVLFDGIISNPPFFQNSLKGPDAARNRARHSDETLSFSALYDATARLLAPGGHFALLLPITAQESWEKTLAGGDLQLAEKVLVHPLPEKAPNRVLYLHKKAARALETTVSELAIYERYGEYSLAFSQLLKPFYLKL